MSFIRPEARAAIGRWREVIAGAAVAALGLYWVLGPGLLLGWVGGAVIAAGLVIALIGVQRARFRRGTLGPGIVTVDEGRITYFGPLTGGMVAVSDIERLILDSTARPAHWLLIQPGQPALAIPVDAKGAEALFDVFSTLPGLRTERMLGALNGAASHAVVIWQKNTLRPMLSHLH